MKNCLNYIFVIIIIFGFCASTKAQVTETTEPENNLGSVSVLLSKEKHSEALEILKAMPASSKTDNNYNLFIGITYHQNGEFDKALVEYFKALHFTPDSVMVNYNLGLLFQQMNNNSKAKEFYEKVIKLKPDLKKAYFNLARVYQGTGNNKKAIDYYKKYLEWYPEDMEAINNLAVAYKDENNLDKAMEYFKKALITDPSYIPAHYNLSLIYILKGDYKYAGNELKLLKKLSPEHAKILNYQLDKYKINHIEG